MNRRPKPDKVRDDTGQQREVPCGWRRSALRPHRLSSPLP